MPIGVVIRLDSSHWLEQLWFILFFHSTICYCTWCLSISFCMISSVILHKLPVIQLGRSCHIALKAKPCLYLYKCMMFVHCYFEWYPCISNNIVQGFSIHTFTANKATHYLSITLVYLQSGLPSGHCMCNHCFPFQPIYNEE